MWGGFIEFKPRSTLCPLALLLHHTLSTEGCDTYLHQGTQYSEAFYIISQDPKRKMRYPTTHSLICEYY